MMSGTSFALRTFTESLFDEIARRRIPAVKKNSRDDGFHRGGKNGLLERAQLTRELLAAA